jgi:hypothetical protein
MLDHFIVFGEAHLHHLLAEYVTHYNQERAHQAKDNLPLTSLPPPPVSPSPLEEVDCRERLGGLLKHYYTASPKTRVPQSIWAHRPSSRDSRPLSHGLTILGHPDCGPISG